MNDFIEQFELEDSLSYVFGALAENQIHSDEQVQAAGKVLIGNGYETAEQVALYERTIRQLLGCKDVGFTLSTCHPGNEKVRATKLGHLFELLQKLLRPEMLRRGLPCYRFSPLLELLLELLSQEYWYVCSGMPPQAVMPDGRCAAEHFNDFILKFRRRAASPILQKQLQRWLASGTKNYQGATHYINHLFSRYARLLVLRFDLGYRINAAQRTDLASCQRDFMRFLANQRHNALFDTVVGYIWRLECAAEKGWHYHCIFFLDGSKSQRDVALCDQFGSYWFKVITRGAGTYWNCNREKAVYRRFSRLGIGMIRHDDVLLRHGLGHAVAYLTKCDFYFQLEVAQAREPIRTFGRGQVAAGRLVNKMGRPRAQGT